MIALWYMLGFISASAAFALAALIYTAKCRKKNVSGGSDDGFLNILKY